MKKHIIYLFFFSVCFGYAQQEQKIHVEVDTTRIRIGEQLQYKIIVDKLEAVQFPKLDSLGALEVVSSSKVDTVANKLIKKYQLTGFDSGSFYVPKQQVFIQNKAYFTDSLLIRVATVAVDTLKQQPFPIKPIVEEPLVFDDFRAYFIWLYLLLGVLILMGVIYYILKKYYGDDSASKKANIPPYQEAIQKLASLEEKELWQNNKTKEYYIELTEIIRVYIGREVRIQTLEATTDELVQLITKQNKIKEIGIKEESISKISEFLKHADFVKFAKLRPLADEINQDKDKAVGIIENLQPILKQYKQENLLAEDDYSNYLKAEAKLSSSEKRKRTFLYTGMFLVILIVLTTFSYQAIKVYKKNIASLEGIIESQVTSGAGIDKDNWQVQSFGNPSLTMHAPMEIPLQSDEVPEQAKTVLNDLEVYSFGNEKIQISITALAYTEEIHPEIEKVMQQSIQSFEKRQNIEDFEYEREPASLENGMKGVHLSGTMKDNGVDKIFRILGFARENKVWQVVAMCNFEDDASQEMLETMVLSVNIEIE